MCNKFDLCNSPNQAIWEIPIAYGYADAHNRLARRTNSKIPKNRFGLRIGKHAAFSANGVKSYLFMSRISRKQLLSDKIIFFCLLMCIHWQEMLMLRQTHLQYAGVTLTKKGVNDKTLGHIIKKFNEFNM